MTRQLIITHNGSDYHGEVATIRKSTLGMEDHGCMTFYLHCEWPGAGVLVGGYALDSYDADKEERVGTAYGLDVVKQVIETVGVEKWEDLPGSHVIVLFESSDSWGTRAHGIAHLLDEDKVLILREHADAWLGYES